MNSMTPHIGIMKTTIVQTGFFLRFVVFAYLPIWFLVAHDAAAAIEQTATPEQNQACAGCHARTSPALVAEWQRSRHGELGIGCLDCHAAETNRIGAWRHAGQWITTIVTPKDCGQCHELEARQLTQSHHARAGEILARLDNVLAEKIAGMPGNNADAVSGCWQCHGTIVKFKRDKRGEILRAGAEGQPVIDPETWPNSGIGRLNPDGTRGSCHACHSRHSFETRISRSPENCGKCHLGADHPQIEVYNESKHGIAFYANRDRMALEKQSWVLGKDYSAAPTCASCHIGSHLTTNGVVVANNHDVGQHLSWTLRPVISTKLNQVVYADGYREDYPDTASLPGVGAEVTTTENVVEQETMTAKPVQRTVAGIITWQERRSAMKGVCLNCHGGEHVNKFYQQYDRLVALYNDKFGAPAQQLMDELTADGVLSPQAPFAHEVQWVFWELGQYEGRRARHGTAMMGPAYTHQQGMYEVARRFYTRFLPAVAAASKQKSPELGKKYEARIQQLLAREEHRWREGLRLDAAEGSKP
jgi:hydroxylamine dehydrogenase